MARETRVPAGEHHVTVHNGQFSLSDRWQQLIILKCRAQTIIAYRKIKKKKRNHAYRAIPTRSKDKRESTFTSYYRDSTLIFIFRSSEY